MKHSLFVAGIFVFFATTIPYGDFTKSGDVFLFVPLFLLATLFYFAACLTFPLKATHSFWLVAVGLRLVALAMPPGDDIHRYLWEGRIQWAGFNPYLVGPDSPLLVPLRDATWALMNHHEYAAIYPPGAELILKCFAIHGPAVFWMKITFALADLVTIYFLLRLLTGPNRYRDAVWYAWNPLVVYSFTGGAHYDSLMMAPLMLAVYALFRAKPMGLRLPHGGWSALAALALGLSISIKLVPLVLIPIFALALWPRVAVLPLVGVIPLSTALYYGFPKNHLWVAFQEFSIVARYNDFIWWITEGFLWSNPWGRNGYYNIISLVAAAYLSWRFRRDWRRAMLWVLGVTLICATVVHPWYITWILPFAAIFRVRAWFVLSGTVSLAFFWWETTPLWTAWQPAPLLSLCISIPPLIVAIYEFRKARSHHFEGTGATQPKLQS